MRNDLKDIVLLRIKRAQDKHGQPLEHIKYGKLGMEEICCKLCSAVLSGLVVHDRHTRTAMINGKKVVTHGLAHARYPLYTEIEIEMENGDKHVSHLCKNCLAMGLSQDKLEIIYAADLAQWLHEHRTRGGDPLWEVHPRILFNIPSKYRELEVI